MLVFLKLKYTHNLIFMYERQQAREIKQKKLENILIDVIINLKSIFIAYF